MKVLLLSPYSERISGFIEDAGDEIIAAYEGPVDADILSFTERVVSYGYRHIVPPSLIVPGKLINIHIGYLPWNRGADPNFWSWHDDTPKGVTIHQIDEGIDTGPILARMETPLNKSATLKETYELLLHREAMFLFREYWQDIRDGMKPFEQIGESTSHKKKDREAIWHHFPLGWDTPVKDVEEFGRRARGEHGKRAGSSGA